METMKIKTYGIKELSEKVQVEASRLGYRWRNHTNPINYELKPYLFLNQELVIFYRDESDCKDHDVMDYKEVTLQDLIDIPTPVVFEVRKDCKHIKIDTPAPFVCWKYATGESINNKKSCHNCRDYEKKNVMYRELEKFCVGHIDCEDCKFFDTELKCNIMGYSEIEVKDIISTKGN